jgi:hypothetical protein
MKRPALSLDYLHKKEHVGKKVNFNLKSLYFNPTVSIVETNETTANFCAKNTIETAKICCNHFCQQRKTAYVRADALNIKEIGSGDE